MKILRALAVLPLLLAEIWAAEAGGGNPALPEKTFPQLEAILRSAVQQSPQMLNRALELEIAENNRIVARSNLLPTLGGWANYLEAKDTRADQSGRLDVTKIGYNFTLTQPVFHWGERRNLAKIGEIQSAIAKGQYREAYRAFAQNLRTDYLRLIVQKVGVERSGVNLEYARSQLAQAEDRLAKKVISELEIAGIRYSVEQATIAHEQNQFNFEMAKASFARLSGTPTLADTAIPDAIPVVAGDNAAFNRLLAGFLGAPELPAPDAITARKQLEVQRLNLANVKTRLAPKINFVAGVSQDEQSYTINVAEKFRVNSIFVGVSGNWTIFDGFSAQMAKRTEIARERIMQSDYKQLTERLTQQAQTQVKLLDFAGRQMKLSDRTLATAELVLKGKQEDFGRGVASETEVGLARIGLLDARVNAYLVRTDFYIKTADFLATISEDPVVHNLSATQ